VFLRAPRERKSSSRFLPSRPPPHARPANGAAAQRIAWVEGLTFRQGGILLTFRRTDGGGQVTELRHDAGTEHSILRPW
jgi:hypothetical protein